MSSWHNILRGDSTRESPSQCPLYFLLLTGCGGTHKEEQESVKDYESYIDAVSDNKGSESKIVPLGHRLSVSKQEDNSYQYEIIISSPHVAMYNIQAIAVDPALDSNSNVYPYLGLLKGDVKTSFNTIPYQANGACSFVSKTFLDDIFEHDQFTLQVMVIWKDSKLASTSRTSFTYNYAQKGSEANG